MEKTPSPQDSLKISLPAELMLPGAESMGTVTLTPEEIAAAQASGNPDSAPQPIGDSDKNVPRHFNDADELMDGAYSDEENERITSQLAASLSEANNDPARMEVKLRDDRNALASVGAKRRNETFTSGKTRKEYAARYAVLHDRYKQSLENQLNTFSPEEISKKAKHEAHLLSKAEEVFRSGDQEKIADLFKVKYHKYKEDIAKEIEKGNITELEQRPYYRTVDWVQGRSDKVVDKWAEMNGKQKLLATSGVSALAVASSVVLPVGLAVSATGATGAVVFSTASSAIKKTMKYRLNAAAKHKNRKAIIGEVTTTDNDMSKIEKASDVLALLDSTIENDKKDNNRTLRRIGYAAVAGAVLGGTVVKTAGWIWEKSSYILEDLADKAQEIVGNISIEEKIEDLNVPLPSTPNIPAIDADMPAMPEVEQAPDVVVQPNEIETPDTVADADSVIDEPVVAEPEQPSSPELPMDDTSIEDELDTTPETGPDTTEVIPADDPTIEAPPIPEDAVSDPTIPEIEIDSENITLSGVDSGDGFQGVLKDQYGLDNDQSWQAYLAIKPHLADQDGVYSMGGGNFGLSSSADLQLNAQASAALRHYIDSLEDDDDLLSETN
jgi:hypothetical protein